MLIALTRRLPALAVLVTAVMFALVTQSRQLGFGVLGVSVIAFLLGPFFRLEPTNQIAGSFIALVVGVLAPRVFAAAVPSALFLSDRALLATCPAILIAATRASFHTPSGGPRMTLALALVGLAGCGRAPSPLYGPAVLLFGVVALAALTASEPGRVRSMGASPLRVGSTLAALTIAALVGLGIASSLPRLHRALIARLLIDQRDRTGFSTSMSLGDMDGMFQSREVVARVRGDDPRYLRGAAFSVYAAGLWEDSIASTHHVPRQTESTAPVGYPEVEFPRPTERYFVPQGATDLRASNGELDEYGRGVWGPINHVSAKRVWYAPGPRPDDVSGPSADDTVVPSKLRERLRSRVGEWVPAGSTPAATMDALRHRLQTDYEYSLHFVRTPSVDPVIDFLETHRSGHCEYFASALALLARAAGVPARVVTGFRVVESSPFSDYKIVRERDAHAWVEAWVDGKWTAFDATPDALFDASAEPTSTTSALFDLASTAWEKVDDFLGARTPFQLSLALVGLVGLLVLVRRLRAPRHAPIADVSISPPLPCLVALERVLARRGLERASHETLALLGDRVRARAAREPALDEVASLLERYAALRYGRIGDEAELSRDMTRTSRSLESAPRG